MGICNERYTLWVYLFVLASKQDSISHSFIQKDFVIVVDNQAFFMFSFDITIEIFRFYYNF